MPAGLAINEAAATTGWSPRMLRYIESAGLIETPRTPSGYRVFGPGELQRLRTLRELLARFECALSDVAFARRLDADPELRVALEKWFEERPQRPAGVDRATGSAGAGEARAPAGPRSTNDYEHDRYGERRRMTVTETTTRQDFKVADISLAEFGRKEIRWPSTRCPASWPCARSTARASR